MLALDVGACPPVYIHIDARPYMYVTSNDELFRYTFPQVSEDMERVEHSTPFLERNE